MTQRTRGLPDTASGWRQGRRIGDEQQPATEPSIARERLVGPVRERTRIGGSSSLRGAPARFPVPLQRRAMREGPGHPGDRSDHDFGRGQVVGRPTASPNSAPGRSESHRSSRSSISAALAAGKRRRRFCRMSDSPASKRSNANRKRAAASAPEPAVFRTGLVCTRSCGRIATPLSLLSLSVLSRHVRGGRTSGTVPFSRPHRALHRYLRR
jgi:hypothetical protein